MTVMPATIPDAELEAARRRAFGVAYRMLGSVSEAEDVAQDALLRLARYEQQVEEPVAWITTAATRLSIDVLRSSRAQRETYVGQWLPEPLLDAGFDDAAAHVELADSLSQAFLVLLERLTPLERAAFLLRDVFDYDYGHVAGIVERTEANARQLVTRARKHLEAGQPRFDPDEQLRDRLLERFLAAADDGDLTGLEALLAEDAVCYSDGGGKASAARYPLRGGERIARAVARMAAHLDRRFRLDRQRARINGQPGVILRTGDGSVFSAMTIDVVDGRIETVRIMRNPDKLAHLRAVTAGARGPSAL
jgi:RNA polymerase sigma-70 factor (ECF subfamily)